MKKQKGEEKVHTCIIAFAIVVQHCLMLVNNFVLCVFMKVSSDRNLNTAALHSAPSHGRHYKSDDGDVSQLH